jgi:hypothetical protein
MALADTDNYFSVKDNTGPYKVLPGDDLVIEFTLSNRDWIYPKNVTAYIDPCPVGWTCEQKTYSFDKSDTLLGTNLTVEVSDSAIPRKYTLYILLKSEHSTRRGNDRIPVTVLTEVDAKALSVEEYLAKQDEEPEPKPPKPEVFPEPEPDESIPEIEHYEAAEEEEEHGPAGVDIKILPPPENKSDLAEGVENLSSSRQFVEYASIVLIVVLVFVAAGAYIAFKKED